MIPTRFSGKLRILASETHGRFIYLPKCVLRNLRLSIIFGNVGLRTESPTLLVSQKVMCITMSLHRMWIKVKLNDKEKSTASWKHLLSSDNTFLCIHTFWQSKCLIEDCFIVLDKTTNNVHVSYVFQLQEEEAEVLKQLFCPYFFDTWCLGILVHTHRFHHLENKMPRFCSNRTASNLDPTVPQHTHCHSVCLQPQRKKKKGQPINRKHSYA